MARFNVNEYISVQERINQFWHDYPDGNIITGLVSPPDDFQQCRYRAKVYRHKDDARPTATGWAFELAGGNSANATSHEENCETSAIGRALANMGYATSQRDRPSREEMTKANSAADAPQRSQTRQNAAPDARPHEPARPATARDSGSPGENANPATDKQLKAIFAITKRLDWTPDQARQLMSDMLGKQSTKDLTIADANALIKQMDEFVAMQAQQPALVP